MCLVLYLVQNFSVKNESIIVPVRHIYACTGLARYAIYNNYNCERSELSNPRSILMMCVHTYVRTYVSCPSGSAPSRLGMSR